MIYPTRLLYIILLSILVLFAPFWVTLFVALVGIILLEYSYDTLSILLIADVVYAELYTTPTLFCFVLTGIAVYTITMLIKPKLLLA